MELERIKNKRNVLIIDKAYPISDEDGKRLTPYTFTLTNTCDSEANYYINLETITSAEKKLSEQYLRTSLKKGNEEVFLNNLNSSYINLDKVISEATNAYKLYQGVLKAKEVAAFNLNLWMDNDAPTVDEVMNVTYEGKIIVSTSYKTSLDTKNLMLSMDGGIAVGTSKARFLNNTYTQNSKYSLSKVVYESIINPYAEAVEVVDFSVAGDESVLGYYVKNEGENEYTLYIQADGKIKINPIASYYGLVYNECGYTCTEKNPIEGIENWDTSNVIDMSSMFMGSGNEALDLSHFDTSKVTNMREMFSWSGFLINLDLSSFDTANVNHYGSGVHDHWEEVSYGGMFYDAPKLENIVYGDKFVYKNNANVDGMYNYCPANKPTHETWNGVFE